MKTCSTGHGQIIYDTKFHSNGCPLCDALGDQVTLVDAKEDIDVENIMDLYDKHEKHERRIKQLEDIVFAQAPRKKFGLF